MDSPHEHRVYQHGLADFREIAPTQVGSFTDSKFHPDGKHIFSSGRDQVMKI